MGGALPRPPRERGAPARPRGDADARDGRGRARDLQRGDAVVFARGAEGAHAIANRSHAVARFVVFSTMVHPDVVEYPESGTVGAIVGDAPTAGRDARLELFFPREAAIGYFEIPRQPD